MARNVQFEAIEADSAMEAIQIADIYGRRAILLDRPMVVTEEVAARLAEEGVEFAYLCYHERSQQIMTVPVN